MGETYIRFMLRFSWLKEDIYDALGFKGNYYPSEKWEDLAQKIGLEWFDPCEGCEVCSKRKNINPKRRR
jgi:hypothetical protein